MSSSWWSPDYTGATYLDIVRAVKDQRGIAIRLNNIAEIYAEIGDYQRAAGLHSEALPLSRSVGDADGEGNSLNNLGKVYANLVANRGMAQEKADYGIAIMQAIADDYDKLAAADEPQGRML